MNLYKEWPFNTFSVSGKYNKGKAPEDRIFYYTENDEFMTGREIREFFGEDIDLEKRKITDKYIFEPNSNLLSDKTTYRPFYKRLIETIKVAKKVENGEDVKRETLENLFEPIPIPDHIQEKMEEKMEEQDRIRLDNIENIDNLIEKRNIMTNMESKFTGNMLTKIENSYNKWKNLSNDEKEEKYISLDTGGLVKWNQKYIKAIGEEGNLKLVMTNKGDVGWNRKLIDRALDYLIEKLNIGVAKRKVRLSEKEKENIVKRVSVTSKKTNNKSNIYRESKRPNIRELNVIREEYDENKGIVEDRETEEAMRVYEKIREEYENEDNEEIDNYSSEEEEQDFE